MSTTSATAAPVMVYYFHATARCSECLQIEETAEEILRQNFGQELADGQLVWRPVNVDLRENMHFVFDFDLVANELVVAKGLAPQEGEWAKLPEVWSLAYDPEGLRTKLVPMVRGALSPMDR